MVSFFLAVACYITVHTISLTTLTQHSKERWLRMMGEWFTDPEHHWQASNLVMCGKYCRSIEQTEYVRLRKRKKKKKAIVHLKAVSMPSILIAASWCPHFIFSIITQRYNCARMYWNIYFPCVSFLLCEKWAEMSRNVKQPIRAELNIIIHDPSK